MSTNKQLLVAVRLQSIVGSIQYDEDLKEIIVIFPLAVVAQKIEHFLAHPIAIRKALSLTEFVDKIVVANRSMQEFREALTMLYHHTGVRVEWSIRDKIVPLLK